MSQNDQAGGGPLDGVVRPGSEAPRWWHCDTHGPGKLNAWGCPDCVAELRRWKSTNAPRMEALEGLLRTAQLEAYAGNEAIATLASEREANAVLTAELAEAEKRCDAMQAALLEAMRVLAKVDPKGCAAWLRAQWPNVGGKAHPEGVSP